MAATPRACQQQTTPDPAAAGGPSRPRSASTSTGGVPSWAADLDAYVASHPGGASPAPGGGGVTPRAALVAAVKASPQSAEAWRALLAHEEAHGAGLTQQQAAAGGDAAGRVSLYHLYYYATQLVPRAGHKQAREHREAYMQLMLGFARQQWSRSPDDARDTFKTLKNHDIGGACAHVYHEWALLEHAAGNVSKALGVLSRGLRAEAQPAGILEQLRAEMQSGTFDLKAATFTETLTLDATTVAARQLQHQQQQQQQQQQLHDATPAPAPPPPPSAKPVPGGPLHATSAQPHGRPVAASCLKAPAPAAATSGAAQEHHAGRAVTFAADVHDASGHDAAMHSRPHRTGTSSAGSLSTNSTRSVARSSCESHTSCLSSSSASSQSTAPVHDTTLPFSTGAVSYKSSTTESSGLGGAEEDTISCRAAGAGGNTREAGAAVKPSTAPLSSSGCTPAPGAGANGNTATLGLKRFGFKSRALRVGGAGGAATRTAHEEPAAEPAASHSSAVVPAPAPASHTAAGPTASTGSAAAHGSAPAAAPSGEGDGAAGRKRRAGVGGTPSPKTSPKLAAAFRHGQQCKVLPDEAAAAQQPGTAGSNAAAAGPQRSALNGRLCSAQQAAAAASGSDEDSVPLVGSKLAARLAHHDHGTPLVASKARDTAAHSLGMWTSPADGQLPSSLDTTPGEARPGTSTDPGSRQQAAQQAHSSERSAKPQGAPSSSSSMAGQAAAQQPQRESAAARRPPAAGAAGKAAEEEQPPLPTLVLANVPAEAVQPSHARTSSCQQPASRSGSQAAGQPGRHAAAAHVQREPLRPLQAPPQPVNAPAGQHGSSSAAKADHHKADSSSGKVAAAVVHQGAVVSQEQQPRQQQQQAVSAAVPREPMAPPPAQPPRQPLQAPQQQQQQQQQQQHAAVRQERPREDAQTVFVQGVRYTKLECVGRGGSSKVFKVMGPGCKIYALKRIRLAGRDPEAASGFIDEINLLQRLRNKPNIIQLVDSQVFVNEGLIYMVQEYGEIDLARLLAKHDAARREAAGPDGALQDRLDENFIRLYWQQMLQAVAGVHEQRIVHSDLKPANFLLVEGQLKLIDFGIAKAISGDTTSIARESQVGTLNYMSPEAILGGSNNILGGPAMKVGRPSDIWSLGCILYQMVYGRTPFAELPFIPKMHAICNPGHRITYPELANADLLAVMRGCLERDPKARISLQELLQHPFLHPNQRRQCGADAPAPPAGGLGLSEEQMKLLVAQVQAAGAAGVTDLDKLTRDLMHRLAAAPAGSHGGAAHERGPAAGAAPHEPVRRALGQLRVDDPAGARRPG